MKNNQPINFKNNQPEKEIDHDGVVVDLGLRKGSLREQKQTPNVTKGFRLLIVATEEGCGLRTFPALNIDFESKEKSFDLLQPIE